MNTLHTAERTLLDLHDGLRVTEGGYSIDYGTVSKALNAFFAALRRAIEKYGHCHIDVVPTGTQITAEVWDGGRLITTIRWS